MNQREKAIVNDLIRFRCMGRDDIADIHFSDTKYPVKNANEVLKRMRRDNHIEANTDMQPFVYFAAGSTMKRNSQKMQHFLAIVAVYRELRRLGAIKKFEVEPKYGAKGTVEPDVFTVITIGGVPVPLLIEVQNTIYSDKLMQEKMDRYETFYKGNAWREYWRGFPNIVILSQKRYELHTELLTVRQHNTIGEFIEVNTKALERYKAQQQGIKVKGVQLTMK